jgi:thymidylate synthase ThyX
MIVENDYSSALEHVVFSFEIHGLSKGNALELLEHRIASHTGRSSRISGEARTQSLSPRKFIRLRRLMV